MEARRLGSRVYLRSVVQIESSSSRSLLPTFSMSFSLFVVSQMAYYNNHRPKCASWQSGAASVQ